MCDDHFHGRILEQFGLWCPLADEEVRIVLPTSCEPRFFSALGFGGRRTFEEVEHMTNEAGNTGSEDPSIGQMVNG